MINMSKFICNPFPSTQVGKTVINNVINKKKSQTFILQRFKAILGC